MTRLLIGRGLFALAALAFGVGALFIVSRTFATEPFMASAFAIFALLMLLALGLVLRRLPQDMRRSREGLTGRILDVDILEETFRAGIGRDRPEGDRTVDTLVAMLWFGLVEAGAWANPAQAKAILQRRGELQSGAISFAALDREIRGGGDLQFEEFLGPWRPGIAEFATGPALDRWLDDAGQFDADQWALYLKRRADLDAALAPRRG